MKFFSANCLSNSFAHSRRVKGESGVDFLVSSSPQEMTRGMLAASGLMVPQKSPVAHEPAECAEQPATIAGYFIMKRWAY